eukprot:TRINITY_DN32805_c0_g1_i1.p1 TRINITY_DN32805_c0_g1~~TRINITY_DN32805_c0_g1_i1.p1  ORF type:complete len:451 (+),score=65.05 TRINITY_DN32805_c0_g1_i1:98-1450(+)
MTLTTTRICMYFMVSITEAVPDKHIPWKKYGDIVGLLRTWKNIIQKEHEPLKAWDLMQDAKADGLYLTGVEVEPDAESNQEPLGRQRVCPEKLEHDVQQLDYLVEFADTLGLNATTVHRLQAQKSSYEGVLDWFEGLVPDSPPPGIRSDVGEESQACVHISKLSALQRKELSETYNLDILPREFESQVPAGPILVEQNWKEIDLDFWRRGYVVIDDVISDASMLFLHKFATESSAFTKVDFPYLGAYLPRVANPITRGIANELPEMLPRVFSGIPWLMLWCYKDSPFPTKRSSKWARWKEKFGSNSSAPRAGSTLHNDFATVNVNIMLGASDAHLEGGGLELFLCDPVQGSDADPEDASEIEALAVGCATVMIPWRPNRAVIYVSSFYHRTEPFRFKPDFPNRRTFLTFLYGKPASRREYEKLAPKEHRRAFLEAVFKAPLATHAHSDEL